MLIRGRVLATCALAIALVTVSAGSASAFQPCPTTNLSSPSITSWETEWPPNPTVVPHGVTQCRAMFGSGNPMAVVQILDMEDGPTVSIYNNHASPQATPASPADWLFTKRTVKQWHDANFGPDNPGPGDLFSITNASFFTDTTSSSTKLSLPEFGGPPGGALASWGAAIHGTDPAWDATKRKLVFGAWFDDVQLAAIGSFPTHYTGTDAEQELNPFFQGLVAFDPLYVAPGGDTTARRTMLGIGTSKVYIVTTIQEMPLTQAQNILQHLGSTSEIQLDGGGSTQMYSPFGFVNSLVNRPVPSVLAVNLGD